jgi:hypothetical protein
MVTPLRITAFTVCIGYDDFLALTLERYQHTFDDLVVVTCASDRPTIELCARSRVRCVESTRRHWDGLDFNLPALANDGYAELRPTGWVCKIDPDIHLPADARSLLADCLDDPDTLWGSRRYFCDSPRTFEAFVQDCDYGLLEPPYGEGGADVLGFLQLFHVRSRYLAGRNAPYEENWYSPPSHTNDRLFSSLWPVERRRRLPFDVVHLGLDAIGTNWRGRQSPRWSDFR